MIPGSPFERRNPFRRTLDGLRQRTRWRNTTGVLAAYLASVYLTVIGEPVAFYEAAAMLVTFVLFGQWM